MTYTAEEWKALSDTEKQQNEAEKPAEIKVEEAEERVKNAQAESKRKLEGAQKQIDELAAKVDNLSANNKGPKDVTEYKKRYEDNLQQDPFAANRNLAVDAANFTIQQHRQADKVRRIAARKLRTKHGKDYEKHADALEDMLDRVNNPTDITEASIQIMFDSLRGASSSDAIKEAEERGRRQAQEEAGIIAVGEGEGTGGDKGPKKTSLSKDQQEEANRMGLGEIDYLDILKGLQEKDKVMDKSPRKLVNE